MGYPTNLQNPAKTVHLVYRLLKLYFRHLHLINLVQHVLLVLGFIVGDVAAMLALVQHCERRLNLLAIGVFHQIRRLFQLLCLLVGFRLLMQEIRGFVLKAF